jgi:hypothetical protein
MLPLFARRMYSRGFKLADGTYIFVSGVRTLTDPAQRQLKPNGVVAAELAGQCAHQRNVGKSHLLRSGKRAREHQLLLEFARAPPTLWAVVVKSEAI